MSYICYSSGIVIDRKVVSDTTVVIVCFGVQYRYYINICNVPKALANV